MPLAIKTGTDKAAKLFTDILEYVKGRAKVEMHDGPCNRSINSRWLSARKKVDVSIESGARPYEISWILDLTVSPKGKTYFEFKVCVRDTLNQYTSLEVDLNSPDWKNYAEGLEWSLDYLCKGQNTYHIDCKRRQDEAREELQTA